ncbi:LOW QUALITY PROTEIN: hypothetical protein CVT25_003300 [Psilocybe cyanescens]|uniref:Uncharacterized protein n=1 Tax=Psilocybe cyanescens TaxID=93625 RepID=A0A409WMC6_PSICY|nr:LOW QUALITY PROTEIN: hypothetical protein CVT25_003300 [Psilocybe cyanescens]
MGFFQGATGVTINGGTFTHVNGSMRVFDQSRHTTNINSYNSNHTTTLNSNNDNSVTSFGQSGSNRTPLRQGQRDRIESAQNNEDVAQYFPPSTPHPMILAQQGHLDGPAVIQNVDSFNVQNYREGNSNNDNSEQYGTNFFIQTTLSDALFLRGTFSSSRESEEKIRGA